VNNILGSQKLNTSYHPQTNGKVERFNSTLVAMLAMYVSMDQKDWDQKDWDQMIPYCVFAYNTSRHELNKYAPYSILFGRHGTLPVDAMSRTDSVKYLSVEDYVRKIIRRMSIAHRTAQMNQREIANKYRELALRRPPPQFEVGDHDKVLVRFYTRTFRRSKKLQFQWKGPYEIVEKKGPVTYEVKVAGVEDSPTHILHVNRLKRFHERSGEMEVIDPTEDAQLRGILLLEDIQKEQENDEQKLADEYEKEKGELDVPEITE
jgi:hypothetical protein